MPAPSEHFPTVEQRAVLESSARITVVKAGPGSGKTRVFVESLKRRLEARAHGSRYGIAALSFTRVAQQEIANRVGSQLPAPHFIGTLDSFLLRFVVRPFGHLIGLKKDGLRLIPSPFEQNIAFPEIQIGPTPASKVSIFSLSFCGGAEQAPEIVGRDPLTFKTVKLNEPNAALALKYKVNEWQGRGWITHSDCHFLAARILLDPRIGGQVAEMVARRFPVVLIDELQDTGWFLSRAITKILSVPSVSGLVVGDPDQAIFEFSGADPAVFEEIGQLPGAQAFALTFSHRCPERVSAVSSALSTSASTINSQDGLGAGRAVLLTHALDTPVMNGSMKRMILDHCSSGDTLAVLTRRTKTLKRLMGHVEYDTPRGFALAATQLYKAAVLLKAGESKSAVGIIEACLGGFAWDHRYITAQYLREKGISRKVWKGAVYLLLKVIVSDQDGESWNSWMQRGKAALLQSMLTLGWQGAVGDLTPKFRNCREGNGTKSLLTPPPLLSDWSSTPKFSTVHRVKGEEYDCVVMFVPKPRAPHSPCPSVDWWATGLEEEKRIAFVAASRAKKTFILYVHEKSFEAFRKIRPEFFALFESGLPCPAPASARTPAPAEVE